MNSAKENKPTHQRNITPNFLRFKSIKYFIKKSQPQRIPKDNKKGRKLIIQLKEVDRKQVETALMCMKNEY